MCEFAVVVVVTRECITNIGYFLSDELADVQGQDILVLVACCYPDCVGPVMLKVWCTATSKLALDV